MAGVALFRGASVVALHALARGLILIGQVLLGDPLFLQFNLLGIVPLLLSLDLLLLFLADALLRMHRRKDGT